MRQTLPVLISLVLLTASGLAHGVRTGRWSKPPDLKQAAARLDRVPLTAGDWEGQALPMDARQLEVGEISGYLMRRYTNRRTGQEVSIMVVCGWPGPIAVHTPDVCYGGSGYEQLAPPARYEPRLTPPAGRPEFSILNLNKSEPMGSTRLRILWAWNDGHGWKTPNNPRLSFAAAPFLYKLYVIRDPGREDAPPERDPGDDLLSQLLPQLEKALFVAP
jgi:hypothetical protein